MNIQPPSAIGTTRRRFLAIAAASAAAYPFRDVFAQQPTAKYLRRNLASHGFPAKVLASYSKAITAMLKLPPTDPRNWYRNAFVHTLDCPHGNWWFPPWHRGYLGWLCCHKIERQGVKVIIPRKGRNGRSIQPRAKA